MAFTRTSSQQCRSDFPALGRTLNGLPLAYLDGPAGTQVPKTVIDAVGSYYCTCNANTHGMFVTSRESDAAMEEVRCTVASFLGAASSREISFGANMTSLTFSLSHALARTFARGDEVVVTELDHEANRGPWLALRSEGITVREVPLQGDGTLNPDAMAAAVTPRTRLLALGMSSNALGTVNDVALARKLTREVGALLLLDAVHYAPHFPIDVQALDADFLLCSAYKFYGPHVGILYCRPGLLETLPTDRLRPQESEAPYRIETGTLNHAALMGVRAAIEYIASWGDGADLRSRLLDAMEGIRAHEHTLAAAYHGRASEIPGVTAWGPGFDTLHRAPTVSITIDGVHPRDVATALGERGLLVWDGDFYATRAIEVLGLADAGGVIRTGISMYNSAQEIDRLVDGIAALARRR